MVYENEEDDHVWEIDWTIFGKEAFVQHSPNIYDLL